MFDIASVEEVFSHTRDLVERCHPRLPGTTGCLLAARQLKEEFEKQCDHVALEEFSQHPGSFFHLNRIIAACYVAASLLLLLSGPAIYISAVVYSFGTLYFATQFVFFGALFDPLFKRRPGTNLVGILEPDGEVRQQIIVSSHHDSTLICNFLERHQSWYAWRVISFSAFYLMANSGAIFLSLAALTRSPAQSLFIAYRLAVLGGLVFAIPFFAYYSREASPGSGDNLLCSVMLSKLAEWFNRGNRESTLQHTRLILLSTDGEEIGQKGARHFVRQHGQDLLATKTYVLNVDSLYKYEDLALLQSDMNGTIKLAPTMHAECRQAADRLGYRIKSLRFPFGGGGTDAARFSQIGVESASLIGISTRINRRGVVYHTSRDTVDYIEKEAVQACGNIVISYILQKDQAAV